MGQLSHLTHKVYLFSLIRWSKSNNFFLLTSYFLVNSNRVKDSKLDGVPLVSVPIVAVKINGNMHTILTLPRKQVKANVGSTSAQTFIGLRVSGCMSNSSKNRFEIFKMLSYLE